MTQAVEFFTVRALTKGDFISDPTLTDACVMEAALAGYSAEQMVNESISLSWRAYEVSVEGEVLAYWGHTPGSLLGDTGLAWMLACPPIEKWKLHAAMASRFVVEELLRLYSDVFVIVDLRHTVAVHWLRWLGFMPAGPLPPFTLMRTQRAESDLPWEA